MSAQFSTYDLAPNDHGRHQLEAIFDTRRLASG